jgi:hypothetical protein
MTQIELISSLPSEPNKIEMPSEPEPIPSDTNWLFNVIHAASPNEGHYASSLLDPTRRAHLYWEVAGVIFLWGIGIVLNILPPLHRTFLVNDVTIQNPFRSETISETLCMVISSFCGNPAINVSLIFNGICLR